MKDYNNILKKFVYTFAMILIYRIGSFISIPGVDYSLVLDNNNDQGLLGFLNIFSGGSLNRISIFSLTIIPYITASIIMQMLSFTYPSIKELNKQGEIGKRKINQLTKYLAVFIATFQAYGISKGLFGKFVVLENKNLFQLFSVISLVTGTLSLIWIADRITLKGVGNGTSIIICTSILSSMPMSVINLFDISSKGGISILSLMIFIIVIVFIITLILFVEQSQRKIPIQYANRTQITIQQGQNKTYFPFRINTAGVMPPIFTSTILFAPTSIINLFSVKNSFLSFFATFLTPGKISFIFLFAFFIVFFSFFYTSNILNLKEISDNLKKSGSYIFGIRPGKDTLEYLNQISNKMTVLGSSYLCLICLLPEIIMSSIGISLTLSGTSILIVINVIMDTIKRIQTSMIDNNYEALVSKKIKIRQRIR